MDKNIKDMSLAEKVHDFEKVSRDKDFSTALEYFYAKSEDYAWIDDAMHELSEYYDAVVYGQSRNSTTEKVYPFTNENLFELFRHLDLKDKRVATVGSSGDQVIHSIFAGAKEVNLIDMNILAEPFIELKIAAIKNLTHKEFLEFGSVISNYTANRFARYYSKISHSLSGKAKDFWDNLVLEGSDKYFYHFTHNYIDHEAVYNSAFTYNQLQEKLNQNDYKINYIFGELEQFPQKLNGKYDLILLSNIIDYYSGFGEGKPRQVFLDTVRDLFKNNLTKDGVIQVSSRHEGFELFQLSKKLKARRISINGAGIYAASGYRVYHTSVMYGGKANTLYDKMKELMNK